MGFREIEHTADVAYELWGASLPELFESAAMALAETIYDPAKVADTSELAISLSEESVDGLLVLWLQEILFYCDAKGFLFREFSILSCEGGRLEALLRGETLDHSRHVMRSLVKAVTWHGLSVKRKGGRWESRVIFDV